MPTAGLPRPPGRYNPSAVGVAGRADHLPWPILRVLDERRPTVAAGEPAGDEHEVPAHFGAFHVHIEPAWPGSRGGRRTESLQAELGRRLAEEW